MAESAEDAARRYLHPGRPDPRRRSRHARILLRDILTGYADDDVLPVVADEVRRRGLKPPKDILALVRALQQRAKAEDSWVLGDIVAIAGDPHFSRLYRAVRLPCEWCAGYLVVRRRSDRRFKFAGCSNYTSYGCRFTMGSRAYARAKSMVVLALYKGRTPTAPYIMTVR